MYRRPATFARFGYRTPHELNTASRYRGGIRF